MAIRFLCPYGHRLRVPDERAGKKGRCPVCHQRVIVPVADPQPSGRRKKRPPGSRRDDDPIELDDIIESTLGLDHEERANPPPASLSSPSPGAAPPSTHPPMPPGAAPPAAQGPIPPTTQLMSFLPPNGPMARPTPIAGPMPGPASAQLAPMPAAPPARGWFHSAAPQNYAEGWRPTISQSQTLLLLGAVLTAIALLSAGPALGKLGRVTLPDWVPIVLLIAGLHVVMALWLVSLPDWTTAWMGMLLCAVSAAIYSAGLALAIASRSGEPTFIDLSDVRNTAGGWCGAMALLFGGACYALGRTATMWRRELRGARAQ